MLSLSRPSAALRVFLREACDALATVIFPAPCRLCEGLIDTASRIPICSACLDSIVPFSGPQCSVCGAPIVSPQAGIGPLQCRLCRLGAYGFDHARFYATYQDAMMHAVVLLKYEPITPLAAWFGKRLATLVELGKDDLAADLVVPVPLHRDRLRERGYNQAGLIARPLARKLGLPFRPKLLVRTKPRPPKHKLSLHERWDSVRGAFATPPGSQVDNLRVLLVDDVMTTGATLDACARSLRRAGASRVIALTVARAPRNSQAVPDTVVADRVKGLREFGRQRARKSDAGPGPARERTA